MARRKKHPKLPNGYGSIKYLGKGRRNPYGVYPPAREINENGSRVSLEELSRKIMADYARPCAGI